MNAADTGNPMRLTCPNCSARYEVDDSLIPPEGRDVQCSNCSTTWFQPGQRARMEEPETAEAAAPQAGRAAPRRDLDPALRDILREEREREEQLRRAAAPVEEQEEMALDSAPPPDRETETDSAAPEEDDEAAAIRQMVEEDSQRPDRPGGRELFPDIEEINSTLRATTDRTAADRVTSDVDTMDRRPRRRRGFRMGFFLMVLIGAGAAAAYHYAPEITAALPQAEPYLTPYVAEVDNLRFQLDDTVQSLVARLAEMSGS